MSRNFLGPQAPIKHNLPPALSYGDAGGTGAGPLRGIGRSLGMGRYGVGIGVYCIAALGRAAALGEAGMGRYRVIITPFAMMIDEVCTREIRDAILTPF